MNGSVKIDIDGYREAIALACVERAPWKAHDPIELRDQPSSVVKVIIDESQKLYPLGTYLLDLLEGSVGGLSPEKLDSLMKNIPHS